MRFDHLTTICLSRIVLLLPRQSQSSSFGQRTEQWSEKAWTRIVFYCFLSLFATQFVQNSGLFIMRLNVWKPIADENGIARNVHYYLYAKWYDNNSNKFTYLSVFIQISLYALLRNATIPLSQPDDYRSRFTLYFFHSVGCGLLYFALVKYVSDNNVRGRRMTTTSSSILRRSAIVSIVVIFMCVATNAC